MRQDLANFEMDVLDLISEPKNCIYFVLSWYLMREYNWSVNIFEILFFPEKDTIFHSYSPLPIFGNKPLLSHTHTIIHLSCPWLLFYIIYLA